MNFVHSQLPFCTWASNFTKCNIKFGNTSDLYYNQLRNWERKEREIKRKIGSRPKYGKGGRISTT